MANTPRASVVGRVRRVTAVTAWLKFLAFTRVRVFMPGVRIPLAAPGLTQSKIGLERTGVNSGVIGDARLNLGRGWLSIQPAGTPRVTYESNSCRQKHTNPLFRGLRIYSGLGLHALARNGAGHTHRSCGLGIPQNPNFKFPTSWWHECK